jgi:RHS repeat-associated protein
MTDHNGLHVFGYDATQQLTSVDYPAASPFPDITYGYDDAGNRLSTTTAAGTAAYASNALNQYTSVGGVAQTYDLNGNLTSDLTNTYEFDAENRMVSAGTPLGAATYAYDPFMRRTKKSLAGVATYFIWSRQNALQEFDNALVRQTRYVVGPSFAPLQVGYGPGLTEPRGDVHLDHLGTPRSMSDDAAVRIWRSHYEVFGGHQIDPASTAELNVRLPGQYFDLESSLHYNWFRVYRPAFASYLSSDPIREDSTRTPYAYARNSPIDSSDPTGRCTNTVDCAISRGGGNAKWLLEEEGARDAMNAIAAGAAIGAGAGIVAVEGSSEEDDNLTCPDDNSIKVNPPLAPPIDPDTLNAETRTPDPFPVEMHNPDEPPPGDHGFWVRASIVAARIIQMLTGN